MNLQSTLETIKDRLRSQQDGLDDRDIDVFARRAVRAELDALWDCVEVLAQHLDGASIVVPDHWSATYHPDGRKRQA